MYTHLQSPYEAGYAHAKQERNGMCLNFCRPLGTRTVRTLSADRRDYGTRFGNQYITGYEEGLAKEKGEPTVPNVNPGVYVYGRHRSTVNEELEVHFSKRRFVTLALAYAYVGTLPPESEAEIRVVKERIPLAEGVGDGGMEVVFAMPKIVEEEDIRDFLSEDFITRLPKRVEAL